MTAQSLSTDHTGKQLVLLSLGNELSWLSGRGKNKYYLFLVYLRMLSIANGRTSK
jgi:hypothetical protein